ncbi:hypothetical protein [Bacillus kexueae]|uniref:hypothetical protein n=1 Tax=Aeribacillus kexueae TaxID=2078952 RepID=UPI001FAFE880|nr:hypothetical protein [Bacillus kexueae]
MKKAKRTLRILYIIPNVLMYISFLGASLFVFLNAKGIAEINRLMIWIVMLLLVLIVSVLQSYHIYTLIKKGEL